VGPPRTKKHATPQQDHVTDTPPQNPYNWSNGYRWIVTITIAVATLCISFASSSYSGGLDDIEKRFGVSTEVGILGISLYVVGESVWPSAATAGSDGSIKPPHPRTC
jgi:hypothetical protein